MTIRLRYIAKYLREDFHELMRQKSVSIETNELCEVRGILFQFHQCKKIVENHHGQISAESEPGKGTTFYISIPA